MAEQAEILKHLEAASHEISSKGLTLDDEARNKALAVARDLVASLEKPQEVIMRFGYHLGSQRMSIRVGLDMGIYQVLADANGQAVTAEELAQICKAEKLLTVRIMRVLSVINFVTEVGHERYMANDITRMMADPITDGVVKTCYDLPSKIQVMQHDYFKERGYTSPTDPLDCPMQWALKSKAPYFEYIHGDSDRLKAFNALMTRIRSTRKHWTEWYPAQSEILDSMSSDANEMILIDMGGARGHDLETFLKKFPSTHGRLMLQDLPSTIESVVGELAPAIKASIHDFFTPQPVKGARAYYMHFVMHDWPDDKCRDILRQIMPAMRPGYSKILLNEIVLPDRNCPPEFSAHDINMMSILAGMERSQAHWVELLESVGLEVINIRTSPFEGDSEGVVEAMLRS